MLPSAWPVTMRLMLAQAKQVVLAVSSSSMYRVANGVWASSVEVRHDRSMDGVGCLPYRASLWLTSPISRTRSLPSVYRTARIPATDDTHDGMGHHASLRG